MLELYFIDICLAVKPIIGFCAFICFFYNLVNDFTIRRVFVLVVAATVYYAIPSEQLLRTMRSKACEVVKC